MRTRSLPMNPGEPTPSVPMGPEPCVACGTLHAAARCPTCGWIADARIGATLAGRYRIDALLGEGGFGRVYRGVSLAGEAPVAIKFLHATASARPDARARFRREALVLSRLRHPGIVAVHDAGEDGGVPYLVMELVLGQPLADLLVEDSIVYSPDNAAALMQHVLGVLEAAHGSGVIHRDIKPENVMLVSSPAGTTVKVLDFGLAFFENTDPSARLTATRMTFGSPYYMSPEQCRGRDVGTPTDIYAAGVMLYELLSGAPPFLGESIAEITGKHLTQQPPPIAQHGARQPAPPELEAIARWALAKRPEDRPTAAAFRAALARRTLEDDGDAITLVR